MKQSQPTLILMGLFDKIKDKMQENKEERLERKKERIEQKQERMEEQKEARVEKREERKEAKAERREAREERREERKEAREDRREARKEEKEKKAVEQAEHDRIQKGFIDEQVTAQHGQKMEKLAKKLEQQGHSPEEIKTLIENEWESFRIKRGLNKS